MSLVPAASRSASPADDGCTALTGATLHLPDGESSGTLVLDGGKVADVGEQAKVPRGCREVDVRGNQITAGLVESRTQIGLVEISLESGTRDGALDRDDPVRAGFRAVDGYNPLSSLIAVTRLGGLTSAVIAPDGGLVSGQGAWVDLAGLSQGAAVVAPQVAMVARIGGPVGGTVLDLRELFDVAQQYREGGADSLGRLHVPESISRVDLESLAPVLDGAMPLVIGADRAADIEALLRLAARFELRLIIAGGAEAWMLAPELARREIPVIVDPLVYGPGSFDQLHARPDNAALLHEAGASVIISGYDSHNARKLRQLAGNAVRAGLDHGAAIRAITEAPARAFGMDDYGRLERGAVANVVVWSGDPLEISTRLTHLFIRGSEVPLDSRQEELFRRYRRLPGTPAPALSLP
jgi:imidazolonepropionase-like amidohydrolase